MFKTYPLFVAESSRPRKWIHAQHQTQTVSIPEVCKSTVSKILKEDTHTAVLVAVWMVVVIVFGVATRGTFSIASTVELVLNEYVSQKIELLASLRYS